MRTLTEVRDDLAGIDKGRRKKDREALTAAHAADEAFQQAQCAGAGHCDDRPLAGENARKAIAGLEGAEPGPGTSMQPGAIKPEQFDRGYLDAGHAAPSPLHRPPNQNPLPPGERGALRPLQMPGTPAVSGSGPIVQAMAAHQARAVRSRPPARGQ